MNNPDLEVLKHACAHPFDEERVEQAKRLVNACPVGSLTDQQLLWIILFSVMEMNRRLETRIAMLEEKINEAS